jgi:Domain of unknown function (DUF5668)
MADMNLPPDPASAAASPPSRRPLFWPVVLIGIGVVALLFNLGWLTWDEVGRLYRLWPLLLIALGIGIMFRGRLPARVANLFGAVLLVLVVIAVGGAVAAIPGAFTDSTGPVVTTHAAAPAGEVAAPHLSLSAGAAQIAVRGGSTGGDLYRATFQSPADEKPDVTLDTATGDLNVNLPGRSGFHWGTENDHRSVDLILDDQLPWVIGLKTGASQTTLDLSTLKVSSVTVESGASSVNMTLPKPTGTVPISVSGGAMHLTIQRPAGTPIRVTSSGGASSVDVDGQHFGGLFHSGQNFLSPDYSSATDRYDITIESGASSIQIS